MVRVVNATSRPLYPRERDPVPIVLEFGWAPGPVGTVRKVSPTPGRQPAVSRSTDCAIPVNPCEIYSEGSGTGSGSSPPYFGLSVSVLFHQCSIFILILPLSCVQEEKAWEYSKFFQISGSTGQKTNNSEHQHHLITFRRCGAIY